MVTETLPEETYAFGRSCWGGGRAVFVYRLNGDLGVGKTVFTQDLPDGLGVEGPVGQSDSAIVKQYDDGQ